eukprot:TRINITY_DN50834_c0_g1_i1.p1 TRINITY_DN50834_c0_g1~~TRINITY_DN50834_c0_g1_i1.p1  ORF type:complete len:865 (+),score=217.67 TRINITY_DN50834_c0_g1_i1:70-2595(+)
MRRSTVDTSAAAVPPVGRDVFHLTRPRKGLAVEQLPAASLLLPKLGGPPGVATGLRFPTPSTNRSHLCCLPECRRWLVGAPAPDSAQISVLAQAGNERAAQAASALAAADASSNLADTAASQAQRATTRSPLLASPHRRSAGRSARIFEETAKSIAADLQQLKGGQWAMPDALPAAEEERSAYGKYKRHHFAGKGRRTREYQGNMNSALTRIASRLGGLRADPEQRAALAEHVRAILNERRRRNMRGGSCVRRNRLRAPLIASRAASALSTSPSPRAQPLSGTALSLAARPGDIVEDLECGEFAIYIHSLPSPSRGLFRWLSHDGVEALSWHQLRTASRERIMELRLEASLRRHQQVTESREEQERAYAVRMARFDPEHSDSDQTAKVRRRWLSIIALAWSSTALSQRIGRIRSIFQRGLQNMAARRMQRAWRRCLWKKQSEREPSLARRIEESVQHVWLRGVKLRRQEAIVRSSANTVKWFLNRFVMSCAIAWAVNNLLRTVRLVQQTYRQGRIIRAARVHMLRGQLEHHLRAKVDMYQRALDEAGCHNIFPPHTPKRGVRHRGASMMSKGGRRGTQRGGQAEQHREIPKVIEVDGCSLSPDQVARERDRYWQLLPGKPQQHILEDTITEVIRQKQTEYRMQLRRYLREVDAWRRNREALMARLAEADRESRKAMTDALAGVAQKAVKGAALRMRRVAADRPPPQMPGASPQQPAAAPPRDVPGSRTRITTIVSPRAQSRPAPAAPRQVSPPQQPPAPREPAPDQARGRAPSRRGTTSLGQVLADGLRAAGEVSPEGLHAWEAENTLGPKPQVPQWRMLLVGDELQGWIASMLARSPDRA